MPQSDVDVQNIVPALDQLNSVTDEKLIFFPFKKPEDETFSRELIEKMDTDADIFDDEYDIFEAESLIDSAEAILAMRLHSMIIAAHLRTPFVPVSYHPKCDGFCDLLTDKEPLRYDNINQSTLVSRMNECLQSQPDFYLNNTVNQIEQEALKTIQYCQDQSNTITVFDHLALLPYHLLNILGEGSDRLQGSRNY